MPVDYIESIDDPIFALLNGNQLSGLLPQQIELE